MEKAKIEVSLLCPDHKDQPLVRVNPDPSAQKHVYCVKCLMSTKDPKITDAEFPTISEFLTTAAATLAEQKIQVDPIPEMPTEFRDVVATQTERLEGLFKHIEGEKQKIKTFFHNITNVILGSVEQVLEQIKNEYLEMADKQVTNLCEIYDRFEKMLNRFYPKTEDIEMMFPTQEDLESRLKQASTISGLNDFFRDIKQLIELNKDEDLSSNSDDEYKERYLRIFSNKLKEGEEYSPEFDEEYSDFKNIERDLKKQLEQLLGVGKGFSLRNPISADFDELNYVQFPESTIIKPQDFVVLKEWLPDDWDFTPKLLFRMTRDGKRDDTFHELCDKMGPTITLIRCRYEDAYEISIIGGFSDKNFDENERRFVYSDKAFVFSMNKKIKFPIWTPEYAICNDIGIEICFGYIGAISIAHNFTSCSSKIFPPNHYNVPYGNVFKIIPDEIYQEGEKIYKFNVEEVEVYQV